MGAAETVLGEDGVGLAGEVAVGIEQQLDAAAQLVVAQEQRVGGGGYVSQVDLYASGW